MFVELRGLSPPRAIAVLGGGGSLAIACGLPAPPCWAQASVPPQSPCGSGGGPGLEKVQVADESARRAAAQAKVKGTEEALGTEEAAAESFLKDQKADYWGTYGVEMPQPIQDLMLRKWRECWATAHDGRRLCRGGIDNEQYLEKNTAKSVYVRRGSNFYDQNW